MDQRHKRTHSRRAPARVTLCLLLLVALSPPAAWAQRAKQVVVHPVAVENPRALSAFHTALAQLEAGKAQRVRVYHFGDSNVAADIWSGHVRQALQERFGDGGAGYLLPRPHGSRHAGPTRAKAGPAFETRRHGYAKLFGPRDGLWGLAGAAMEGAGPGAWFEVRTPPMPEGGTFELHLLGQSTKGRVAVVVDRRRPDTVDTHHPSGGLVRQMWPLSPGAHFIKGQVVSANPVRVLGMVVERNRPGVIYDTLGINGHRVTAINLWNVPLLTSQFRQRPPDLVVLSYGGNEALSTTLQLTDYEQRMRKALVTIRQLAPQASCLLVGPVSMCPERRKLTRIAEIQRRVAPEYGCGFWDTRQVSGGPGSLCNWIAADRSLVSRDKIHLRQRGYELIASEFTDAILDGYSPPAKQAAMR